MKLFYCIVCKRIFESEESCKYCGSSSVKELKKDTPVNILGTKLKGRVLKIGEHNLRIIVCTDTNERVIKEYSAEKLRKIL
ncbi:hypothetical protein CPJCM30710_19020 [Clostridium polyendosporum]|uniref:Uncharacterized protein n=1 Tax=Clostridium polyendosporum TaxID=69208 RepID=A0A919VH24_9CLOT|nr:hypothetical protein [Clostridium polyendosporum]GIM29236.1 hypothetical protein CPJCM30710_19020 [Clostridium polyendosporum]